MRAAYYHKDPLGWPRKRCLPASDTMYAAELVMSTTHLAGLRAFSSGLLFQKNLSVEVELRPRTACCLNFA